MTTIMGHTLTRAELRAMHALQDFLRENSGDSHWGPSTSPKGDGRWFTLLDVFGRSAKATAQRKAIRRLGDLGVLNACEIALCRDEVKGVPLHHVEAAVQQRRAHQDAQN